MGKAFVFFSPNADKYLITTTINNSDRSKVLRPRPQPEPHGGRRRWRRGQEEEEEAEAGRPGGQEEGAWLCPLPGHLCGWGEYVEVGCHLWIPDSHFFPAFGVTAHGLGSASTSALLDRPLPCQRLRLLDPGFLDPGFPKQLFLVRATS